MKKAIEKSRVLLEALPYIQAFHGKAVVIKYGGSSLAEESVRKSVLKDIVFMHYVGMRPVIVHGGGPSITSALERKGIRVRFVNGMRYTSKRIMSVVKRELNRINQQIIRELEDMNCPAGPLTERDGILKARQKDKALGFVGDVIGVNANPIFSLLNKNVVPVITPLGVNRVGDVFNVNADVAAAEVAVAVGASKVVFMTNVDGIMNGKRRISSIDAANIKGLIDKGVISGGMLPKVSSALAALERGVDKAHIVNARVSHALLLEIFTNKGIGTEITL